jgi:hypothetical protein
MDWPSTAVGGACQAESTIAGPTARARERTPLRQAGARCAASRGPVVALGSASQRPAPAKSQFHGWQVATANVASSPAATKLEAWMPLKAGGLVSSMSCPAGIIRRARHRRAAGMGLSNKQWSRQALHQRPSQRSVLPTGSSPCLPDIKLPMAESGRNRQTWPSGGPGMVRWPTTHRLLPQGE